eukprot:TRINITY_DN3774_c0_g1_i1.p1 TRINITY_DN3774_c0_g1~~TRINITY_DN3774_c0_g1_i1.p1  ORF type:complete len:262 (-),score=37.76 TRINITY_DN3774_c0_g1_i1:96-881(-)
MYQKRKEYRGKLKTRTTQLIISDWTTVTSWSKMTGCFNWMSNGERKSKSSYLHYDPVPFGHGGDRVAFFMMWEGRQFVLKHFKKFIRRRIEAENWMMINLHETANEFAKKFNYVGASKKKLRYIQAIMISDDSGEYWMAEEYLPGDHIKWNNNGKYVKSLDEGGLTAQAFSHFTWVSSGKSQLIVDIQGVKQADSYILTDPAIHTVDKRWASDLNYGENGIKEFFECHKCNDICRAMGLERHLAQPHDLIHVDPSASVMRI